MSKNEEKGINELLTNTEFISWVTSGYKSFNDDWTAYRNNLDANEKVIFTKAIKIIEKIRTLNIDDHRTEKSPEFIQQQYIKLLEASSKREKPTKVFRLTPLFKYAAAVVLLFAVASTVVLMTRTTNSFEQHLAKVDYNSSDILIQTSDDAFFKIDAKTNHKWLTNNGVFVNVNDEKISFTASEDIDVNESDEFKIIVPKAKNYVATLIDGTSVELNAETTFTFNNSVNSKTRNVAITGEAFFEVASNKQRPFKVQSSDMTIEVLGTEFNVSNYPNTDFMSTTLVEGSIKVTNPQNESQLIKPGFQAKMYRNQNNILVESADIQSITAWTTGRLIFSNENLASLLPKLDRWFDKEFKIRGEQIKDFTFTGTLKKENELIHFLQMLEYTEGINYEIENDIVTLFKK